MIPVGSGPMADDAEESIRTFEKDLHPADNGQGPKFDWPAIISARQSPHPWIPPTESLPVARFIFKGTIHNINLVTSALLLIGVYRVR